MDQVTLAKNQVRADNWRSLIQECQQSGQTVVQWCQTNNINTKTYYYWLRKLRTQALAEMELPVPVEASEPASRLFRQRFWHCRVYVRRYHGCRESTMPVGIAL